jgi:hypothetical protein
MPLAGSTEQIASATRVARPRLATTANVSAEEKTTALTTPPKIIAREKGRTNPMKSKKSAPKHIIDEYERLRSIMIQGVACVHVGVVGRTRRRMDEIEKRYDLPKQS